LALSVENLAEDAGDVVSVVSHENHVLHPLLYPNETTMVMNCDADAMNVGYS